MKLSLDAKIVGKINSVVDRVDKDYLENFVTEYIRIGDNPRYGGVHAGSDAEHRGAEFIAEELRKIGMDSVELVEIPTDLFQFNDAEIRVGDDIIYPYAYISPETDGITAPIIDAGFATVKELEDIDVSGKIALIQAMGALEGASLSCQINQAEKMGAVAVIVEAVEDVLNEETIRVQPLNYVAGVPVVGVCARDASALRKAAEKGLDILLTLDTVHEKNGGATYEIVGEIKGASTERVIYSAHYDHFHRCIQDDVSAVATLLGIAKAVKESGYVPEKTLTFIFNGSHETGNFGSRYPYIAGSYKFFNTEKGKEVKSNAIVDINFEYTALNLKKIGFICSPELAAQYEDFRQYIPAEIIEYKPVTDVANCDDYYLFAWTDNISYNMNGIPGTLNDSITEQIYEGDSPYIGRDHSNHDNLDAYSKDDHYINTKLFAAYGVYMCEKPAVMLDFSRRLSEILLPDEAESLKAMGIDCSAMEAKLSELCDLSNKALEKAGGCTAYTEEVAKANKTALCFNEIIVKGFDRITPDDFTSPGHRKYLTTIGALNAAKETLAGADINQITDAMKAIDIAATAWNFDSEITEYTKDIICGENKADTRLWSRGQELSCLTMDKSMKELRKETPDLAIVAEEIEAAIKEQTEALIKIVAEETEILENAKTVLLEGCN